MGAEGGGQSDRVPRQVAPEPADVIWRHLGVSKSERRYHARIKAIKASSRKRLYGDLLRPASRGGVGTRPPPVGGPLVFSGCSF